MKRFLSYFLLTLGVLLLSPLLLYLPAIQKIAKEQVVSRLSSRNDMELEVKELQLRFPLSLQLKGVKLHYTDTLTPLSAEGRFELLNVVVDPLPLWRGVLRVTTLQLEQLQLDLQLSQMGLKLSLPHGVANEGNIHLSQQRIHLHQLLLQHGDYQCTMATTDSVTVADSTPSSTPWEIEVGEIALRNSRGVYAQQGATPKGGFDPNYIDLTQLNLIIDTLYNRGATIKTYLADLNFTEQSGLVVEQFKGYFALDSAQILLDSCTLRTPHSSASLYFNGGSGVLEVDEKAPIDLTLEAEVGVADIALFLPPSQQLPALSSPIHLEGRVSGRLAQLEVNRLSLEAKELLSLALEGEVKNLLDREQLAGWGKLKGEITKPDQLLALLPMQSLRLNTPLSLELTAQMEQQELKPTLHLKMGGGELRVDGSWLPQQERYQSTIVGEALPIAMLLPESGIEHIDAKLSLSGSGYTPLTAVTQMVLQGEAKVQGEVLSAQLALEGALRGQSGEAQLQAKEVTLRMGGREGEISELALVASTTPDRTQLTLEAPHLAVDLNTATTATSIAQQLTRVGKEVGNQLKRFQFDAEQIVQLLPHYQFNASIDSLSPIYALCMPTDMGFERVTLKSSYHKGVPWELTTQIDGVAIPNGGVDTLTLNLAQQERAVAYRVAVGKGVEDLAQLSQLQLSGNVVGDTLALLLQQRDSVAQERFDVGMVTLWSDTAVQLSLHPQQLLLLGDRWEINPNNSLCYYFDRHVTADLKLESEGKRIHLHSVDLVSERNGEIRVNIEGLALAPLVAFTPLAQQLSGEMGANLTLGFKERLPRAEGTIVLDSINYNQQDIGNLTGVLNYEMVDTTSQKGRVALTLNGCPTLSLDGYYAGGEGRDSVAMLLQIDSLPLALANPYIPNEMASVTGALVGEIALGGSSTAPQLNGYLQLPQTSLYIPMAEATFRLGSDTIKIEDSVIAFDRFPILGANSNPLYLAGRVSAQELSDPSLDLTLEGRDWGVINTPQSREATLFGKVNVDVETAIKGSMREMNVAGDIGILNGTDVTYQLSSSPLGIERADKELVTFVNFNDTLPTTVEDSSSYTLPMQLNVRLNLDIASAVKVGVNLQPNTQDRVELQGGGRLSYSMNGEGDSRLSGKYELSGGSARYAPPIISEKEFAIQQGSYVEWSGDMLDPMLNLTAIDQVRSSVNSEDGEDRMVSFDIIVGAKNGLDNLDLVFDLAAPNDIAMQNELSSLTADQRANQAMNLLLYNTYTGGTTATVGENPLNSFIQKELNSWTRDNLKVVDLTFGIDTESGGLLGSKDSGTNYSYQLSKSLFDDRVKVMVGGHYTTDNDVHQDAAQTLLDDISIEYMLDKRDNMFLKVFRQSGYESILEGEIIETGVGFVFRKKLLYLGELFKWRKPKVIKSDEETK